MDEDFFSMGEQWFEAVASAAQWTHAIHMQMHTHTRSKIKGEVNSFACQTVVTAHYSSLGVLTAQVCMQR